MKTMLIIDDSSYMREVIKVFVGKFDITVIGEAENGKDGVEQYIKHMPDIVVLDLIMGEGNGLEALEKIMAHNPGAVVIIITSMAGKKNPVIDEAMALGAKKIFKKPIDKNDFNEYMKELLDRSGD
jgi:two-component system chemotaxis response regulator CheY